MKIHTLAVGLGFFQIFGLISGIRWPIYITPRIWFCIVNVRDIYLVGLSALILPNSSRVCVTR